jgi:hypothetical protein
VIDERLRIAEKQLSLFDVRLRPETYEEARKHAPGWDIYMLETEWREWGAHRCSGQQFFGHPHH